jgi:ABC-type multidrug transport system fused ATPase/permease subunit
MLLTIRLYLPKEKSIPVIMRITIQEIKFDQVKFAYPTRPASAVLNKLQLTVQSGKRNMSQCSVTFDDFFIYFEGQRVALVGMFESIVFFN